MENKEYKLPILNNCLANEAFVQINIAPEGPVRESELENRLYHVRHEGVDHYMKLVDILRVQFKDITSTMTLPATALELHEFRKWWLGNNPQTTEDTMMAVYYFKKHKQ